MGSNQTPVLSRTLGQVLHVWKSLAIFGPGEKFLSPMALIIGGVHTLLLTPPPMFRGGSGIVLTHLPRCLWPATLNLSMPLIVFMLSALVQFVLWLRTMVMMWRPGLCLRWVMDPNTLSSVSLSLCLCFVVLVLQGF